jgi:phosphoglycerate dehydrogenase-like enzyme
MPASNAAMPNVVCAPHIGAQTVETHSRIDAAIERFSLRLA